MVIQLYQSIIYISELEDEIKHIYALLTPVEMFNTVVCSQNINSHTIQE